MNAYEIKRKFVEKDYQREIERLRIINSNLSSQLKRATSVNEDAISRKADKKIRELSEFYNSQIQKMEDYYNREIDKLNKKFIDKKETYIDEINKIKKNLKKELDKKEQLLNNVIKENKNQTDELINNYEKRINQLEKENVVLLNENNDFNSEINRLKVVIEEKNYELDKLRKQVNMNSSNSGIPTSKESFSNKSRTNQYNHREKSGKPSGGQKGHPGRTLTKDGLEKIIKDKNLKTCDIYHYIRGKKGKKVKYVIGIKTDVCIERHIFLCAPQYNDKLPRRMYSDVTYNNDLKVFVTMLGNYYSLSYKKISEMLCFLTDGIIKLSDGTIDNIYEEMDKKSELTINNIESNIKNGKYAHTDEITTSENGRGTYYRGYANDINVLYKYHDHKGDKPIEEDGILTKYYGTIISDHEPGIFKYGKKHQDCLVHIGRYCKEGKQNIKETDWQMGLYQFLLGVNDERERMKKLGIKKFSEPKVMEINKEYDDFLKKAYEQNLEIKSTYWKDRENALYNRLLKYKPYVLEFIYDFDIPFHNNHMELLLRMVKNKTKMSGGFRSHNGGKRFGDIMSIIKTAKLRELNPYDCIYQILECNNLFA